MAMMRKAQKPKAAQVPVKHKKKKSHSSCSKAGRKLRTCTKKT